MQRPDDRPETIGKRLTEYREKTAPLIGYYDDPSDPRLERIDALAPIAEVTRQLGALVGCTALAPAGAP
jgi:adenylate kinase